MRYRCSPATHILASCISKHWAHAPRLSRVQTLPPNTSATKQHRSVPVVVPVARQFPFLKTTLSIACMLRVGETSTGAAGCPASATPPSETARDTDANRARTCRRATAVAQRDQHPLPTVRGLQLAPAEWDVSAAELTARSRPGAPESIRQLARRLMSAHAGAGLTPGRPS
jgi:hypothetical protein